MIAATFASRSILVLNDAPDWDSMSAVFESITQMEAGLSGREGRRPVASTMRARLRYGCTIEGAAALATQAALRSYTTQPIVVPLWPMATAVLLMAAGIGLLFASPELRVGAGRRFASLNAAGELAHKEGA